MRYNAVIILLAAARDIQGGLCVELQVATGGMFVLFEHSIWAARIQHNYAFSK